MPTLSLMAGHDGPAMTGGGGGGGRDEGEGAMRGEGSGQQRRRPRRAAEERRVERAEYPLRRRHPSGASRNNRTSVERERERESARVSSSSHTWRYVQRPPDRRVAARPPAPEIGRAHV